jgi:hypothetical protein
MESNPNDLTTALYPLDTLSEHRMAEIASYLQNSVLSGIRCRLL